MSAYIVAHDTIDLITSAAAHYAPDWVGRISFPMSTVRLPELRGQPVRMLDFQADREAVARCLYAENVHSVNVRYREQTPATDYRFRPVNLDSLGPRAVPIVLKSIACLKYQSCESDDYEQSAAYHLLQEIEQNVIRSLWSDADPWGWERPESRPKVVNA